MKRIVLFMLPLLPALGCSGPPPGAPQPPEPPIVTVAYPTEQDFAPYIEVVGHTEAIKMVDIVPEVSGMITTISFKDGAMVKSGDVLYVIDPVPYKAMADKAAADVKSATALVALADADLARIRQAGTSISKIELDQSIAKRDSAFASLKAAEAEVVRTEFNLSKTTIRAPISGRIERTLLTEGNLVSANTTKLTRIVSLHPIYAYYNVDEMTSLRYRDMIVKQKTIPDPRGETKLKAWIKLKNEQRFVREGKVDYIDAEMSRASATRTIRGVFNNEDGFISPGDSVRVRVEAGPQRKAILIPETAVGSQQGKKYVFTINDKNEAQMTFIEVGEVREGMQVVESGLTAKDKIVVNGLLRVRAGVTVKPVEQNAKSSELK